MVPKNLPENPAPEDISASLQKFQEPAHEDEKGKGDQLEQKREHTTRPYLMALNDFALTIFVASPPPVQTA